VTPEGRGGWRRGVSDWRNLETWRTLSPDATFAMAMRLESDYKAEIKRLREDRDHWRMMATAAQDVLDGKCTPIEQVVGRFREAVRQEGRDERSA
jgi:hypothetical protein